MVGSEPVLFVNFTSPKFVYFDVLFQHLVFFMKYETDIHFVWRRPKQIGRNSFQKGQTDSFTAWDKIIGFDLTSSI